MPTIPITVSAYAGYKAEERPQAFTLGERTFQVTEILDRWLGEDHAYFKLRADDGNLYLIRYDQRADNWELVLTETQTSR
jgi:hypothetical protein